MGWWVKRQLLRQEEQVMPAAAQRQVLCRCYALVHACLALPHLQKAGGAAAAPGAASFICGTTT